MQALKHKHLKDISSLYMFLSSLKCLLKARQGVAIKLRAVKYMGQGVRRWCSIEVLYPYFYGLCLKERAGETICEQRESVLRLRVCKSRTVVVVIFKNNKFDKILQFCQKPVYYKSCCLYALIQKL